MGTISTTLTGQRTNIGFYERNMKQTRVLGCECLNFGRERRVPIDLVLDGILFPLICQIVMRKVRRHLSEKCGITRIRY